MNYFTKHLLNYCYFSCYNSFHSITNKCLFIVIVPIYSIIPQREMLKTVRLTYFFIVSI